MEAKTMSPSLDEKLSSERVTVRPDSPTEMATPSDQETGMSPLIEEQNEPKNETSKNGVADQMNMEDVFEEIAAFKPNGDGTKRESEVTESEAVSVDKLKSYEHASDQAHARLASKFPVLDEMKSFRRHPQHVFDGDLPQAILLGLPIDSLHSIASFLTPSEWSNFGMCGKAASRVCRDVFRRVRMHGFRCATEVVTAWVLNQHADAKELCALYIRAGVPIYPLSLGHSYHTLVWRIGIEAKEMQKRLGSTISRGSASETFQHGVDNTATDGAQAPPIDQFFVDRYEARIREGLNYTTTYLEEKSIYVLNSDRRSNDMNSFTHNARRHMSTRSIARHPNNNNLLGEDDELFGILRDEAPPPHLPHFATAGLVPTSSDEPRRGLIRSNSFSELRRRVPKVQVKVHRHLLDQHLLGRPSVEDNDGLMTTPTVSLSADFFHPHFTFRPASRTNPSSFDSNSRFTGNDGFVSGELLPAWNQSISPHRDIIGLGALGNGIGDFLADPTNAIRGNGLHMPDATDDSESEGEPQIHQIEHDVEAIFEPLPPPMIARQHQRVPPPPAGRSMASPYSTPTYPNILNSVDLEVFSASSTNAKVDADKTESLELRKRLRARFGVFQRKLEALLAQNDNGGFDECILDFWDEFLPQTANIHYYDRQTPVPRISCLQKFLTQPCPQAIGVVQCEIERIKLGSKKKGVGMKGRFFPTYEYRLFIRHRPAEAIDGSEPIRRDAVLMMAKNRGRKHFEASASSSGVASKKGANNYLLYIPQQEDVDQHFKSVNGLEVTTKPAPNGANIRPMPPAGSTLMGRLQSNFIGTEFQIFTPRPAKMLSSTKGDRKLSYTNSLNPGFGGQSTSDDEMGYDSGVSSDNPSLSGRRRSRFGRLSLRRNGNPGAAEATTIMEKQSLHLQPEIDSGRHLRRSRSSGEMNETRRTRTSRRAIANSSEGRDSMRPHVLQSEEENGAITYTANLLGSRPRIMDVCIPKVSSGGKAGVEWKKYIDMCMSDADDSLGNRMLNHLKQIQQRMENDEHGRAPIDGSTGHESTEDYSPPEDFGLLALQNRPPWWNIELGSFVLNFGGRVSVASVKNFQLCDRSDQDYIMLQFGRIQGRHSFTMDFQYPLTAVQAFAIAISSLQSKISFG